MRKHGRGLWRSACWLAAMLVISNAAAAADDSDRGGLDLVVLVDQSGSMSGGGGAARNDPLNMRNAMVRVMLDHLESIGGLNRVEHRLGVISFGTATRIDLPLSEVNPSSIEQLRRRVDAMALKESLKSTHFIAAFEAAARQFAAAGQDQGRKRAVLLITDGAPYVKHIQVGEYQQKLTRLVRQEFPHPQFDLKVVALNDQSGDYWERYRDLWRDLSNNNAIKLEGNEAEMFKSLLELFAELTGTAAELIPKTDYERLAIPPYLDSVAFNIFSVDPEGDVEIHMKNGEKALSEDDPTVDIADTGKYIKTIVVRRPEPGLWKIRKVNDAEVEVFRHLFFPRGKLLVPAGDADLRQYERSPIVYRVVDGDGQAIRELEGYPLSLELSLVRPDDSVTRHRMIRAEGMGDSAFSTESGIEYDLAGSYRTEVAISTLDVNANPVTIFRDQFSGFTVRGALRIDCRILSPEKLARAPLFGPLVFWPRTLPLRFEFVDERGQPINLPAVFQPPLNGLLDVRFEAAGEVVQAAVELEDLGNGVLAGRAGGLMRPGRYRLAVRPEKAQLPPRYSVRMVPDGVTFSRTLSPVHWLQLVLLGTIVLGALGIGSRTAWLNWRAPLDGELYLDRLGGPQIGEYPLPRRHRAVLKELPQETLIRKIIVRRRRTGAKGMLVTVRGVEEKYLLRARVILNNGQAPLEGVPYVLKHRAK